VLGPATATFALTRTPTTDNARMKTRTGLIFPDLMSVQIRRCRTRTLRRRLNQTSTPVSSLATVRRVTCSLARVRLLHCIALRLSNNKDSLHSPLWVASFCRGASDFCLPRTTDLGEVRAIPSCALPSCQQRDRAAPMLNAMRTADLRELEATAQRGTMRRPAADALLAVIMPKSDGRIVGPEPKRPDPFYHSAGHEQFRKAVLKHAGYRCEWIEPSGLEAFVAPRSATSAALSSGSPLGSARC